MKSGKMMWLVGHKSKEDHKNATQKKTQKRNVWKLVFCHQRAIKLTQNCVCFTSPYINLFVPRSVTRECHYTVFELQAVPNRPYKRNGSILQRPTVTPSRTRLS